jgi:phage recombination protein Bet
MTGNKIQTVGREDRSIEFVPFGSDTKIKLTVKMVQEFICIPTKSGKTCTDRDAMKFIMLCQARALNPWEGDAYLQGYDSKDGPQFSLITAHNAFLKRAELHPEFDGFQSGVTVKREDGSIHDIEGDFFDQAVEEVVGGWCRVSFKNRKTPMYKRLRLATFDKTWGVWEKNKEGMIVKCAEADALRSSFPTKVGGLYLAGELQPGSEEAFRNAKPATVASTNLLPEPTRDEALESINQQAAQPDQEKVPAESAPTEAPARSEKTVGATIHQELRAVLAENDITPDAFLNWAVETGNALDSIGSIDELSEAKVRTLLKGKAAMIAAIKGGGK